MNCFLWGRPWPRYLSIDKQLSSWHHVGAASAAINRTQIASRLKPLPLPAGWGERSEAQQQTSANNHRHTTARWASAQAPQTHLRGAP